MYNLFKIGNTCINKDLKEDNMRNIRRDNRARDNKDVMQNKIIIYCIIGVVGLTIILFGLLLYSKYLNENIQNDVIDFEEMANITSKENNINNTNTETESVSTQIGKSVNEAQNETNNINNTNSINSTVNTKAQTNATKTTKEETNKTTKVKESEEKEESKKELSFERPVEGEIMKAYAKDNLVYSETLQEWTTHLGIDIKADKTTVVKAAEAGTVKTIKNDPRYGLTIIIEHDDGYKTVYANLLSSEFVVEGEKIEKGQSIGTVGNTATFEIVDEPHLHFEILKDGVQIDPSNFIK